MLRRGIRNLSGQLRWSQVSGIHAAVCLTIDPYNSGGLIALELSFDVKGLEIFEEKVSAKRLRCALETALEKAMDDVDLGNMLRAQYRTLSLGK